MIQKQRDATQQHMTQQYCQCKLCLQKNQQQKHKELFPEKLQNGNYLHTFLEYFPKNFPLPIYPISVASNRTHYFNKITRVSNMDPTRINNFTEQYRLMSINYNNRITQHFPLAINLFVFYKNKVIASLKHELLKQDQSYLYIQGCHSDTPLTIYFDQQPQQIGESSSNLNNQKRNTIKLDQILVEKLDDILVQINTKQNYMFCDKTRDFLGWVHKEYGDQIFCYFMTKFYVKFIYITKRDRILKGVFNWTTQKPGIARLANVTDLIIQPHKELYSFQQQYQQRIKQKINTSNIQQIKLFRSNTIKKKEPNIRVSHFRSNIKKLYEQQKLKVLKQTEKQRVVEIKSMSDDIARLFLPELKNYSGLREVLSDQAKFRKVVLRQKAKKDLSLINPHNQPKVKLQIIENRNKQKHRRTKTQYSTNHK